jgi:hypothetical protein
LLGSAHSPSRPALPPPDAVIHSTMAAAFEEIEGELWLRWPAEDGWVVSNQGRVWSNKLEGCSSTKRVYRLLQSGHARYPKLRNTHVHVMVATLFVPGRTAERCSVDHRNGNKSDNRACNLRWCTPAENSTNYRRQNVHGYTGVSMSPGSSRFRSRIRIGDKLRSLGTFDTEREAGVAYARKARELQGEFMPLHLKQLLEEEDGTSQ